MTAEPGRGHLVLDRGIAPHLGHADQAEERQQQLVQRLHLAVREDRRPAGVDAHGQVVGDLAEHVLRQPGGHGPVRHHLVVGDQDQQVHAGVLQQDPVLQGAEVVADMQRAGGPVAGEHAERRRTGGDGELEVSAPLLGGEQGAGCCRVGSCRVGHDHPPGSGWQHPWAGGQVRRHCVCYRARRPPRGEPSHEQDWRPPSAATTSTSRYVVACFEGSCPRARATVRGRLGQPWVAASRFSRTDWVSG